MNSAFMHCSQKTGQQLRLKKKKKRENADAARLSAIQTYTIPFFLPISWGSPFFMVCYILIFLCKLLKQYIKDTIFNPKF